MKFTFKVFFCTITVIAAALGFSGTYLIGSQFREALNRETRLAMDENNVLRFAFETVALNAPLKYERLQDKTIEEIAAMLWSGRSLRVSGEGKQVIYNAEEIRISGDLLDVLTDDAQAYRVITADGQYFVHTATNLEVMGRLLYLETIKDISSIFENRDRGFATYRYVALLTLLGGAVVMTTLSLWLTRPIRILSRAVAGMTGGDYGIRARKVSGDEFGGLTDDFNAMTDRLAEKIAELQDAAESRERFVAAFAHELRTPLTSIVGYADILRSCEMDGDGVFSSANYIYAEGKRLETLSFRLLDILVLKNTALETRDISVSSLFSSIGDMFNHATASLSIRFDEGDVTAEAALLQAVLVNLTENAIKASEDGGIVEVAGSLTPQGYRFSVRDHGCGVPPDEIGKLTQPFYTLDKSRSRSRHSLGLGLTLCAEILALHNSTLELQSAPGEGTEASFVIALNASIP